MFQGTAIRWACRSEIIVETGGAPTKISAHHVGAGTATSIRIMLPASVVEVVARPWLLHQRIFFPLEDMSGGNVCH